MYTHLTSVTLKTGEQMELGVVRCPDPSWGKQIMHLLGHKSRETRDHFAAAFAGPLDELETRFYIGTIGGFTATNVMIVGARGAGILGHVYTVPEHRQKGAYSQLMTVQMEDIRRAGYYTLTLGTGFEIHPYWIYHRFGFRSIDGTSGRMKWLASPNVEAQHFRPGATRVRPMRWDDWAQLNLLALQPVAPDDELPRSWTFRVKGQGSLEGTFQVLQRNLARKAPITALALESAHGATAGWAVLQPDDIAFGDGRLLDLYVHPAFRHDAGKLLDEMPWPERGRVAAYTTDPHGYRWAALRDAGFAPITELPHWMRRGETPVSLHVLTRGGS
ncbi:MAG: GNAT family N-acetyltransferase [Chloroflexi bacterium]|nr:GNAT family N-acetyltransferase [Chloroflexota bacterium]